MTILCPLDLTADVGRDWQAIFTAFLSNYAQLGIAGASATLLMQPTEQDAAPLVQASTGAGSLVFGVAPPLPAGFVASDQGALATLGTAPTTALGIYGSVVATVATTSALQAVSTAFLSLSNVALVTSGPGSYFFFSPLDPSTPNGTTIIAATDGGGNWLAFGTVTANIPGASMAALAGFDRVKYSLDVTWSNGAVMSLFGGRVNVKQTLGFPF